MTHPGEEKYRKIRIRNKAFQDKVASVPGAMMFLEAVGFHQQLLPHQGALLLLMLLYLFLFFVVLLLLLFLFFLSSA